MRGVTRRLLTLLGAAAGVALVTVHATASGPALRASYRITAAHPLIGARTGFTASGSRCERGPCAYSWTAKQIGPADASARVRLTIGGGRVVRYVFQAAGVYSVRLTLTDRAGNRASRTHTVVVSTPPAPAAAPAAVLPHDRGFVGPSYYGKFAQGPSTSLSYFPINTYQLNLAQWNPLPARITAMGVNGVADAYDQSDQSNFDLAAANGLSLSINGGIAGRRNSGVVRSYAMQDEPNTDGSKYAASSCSPDRDSCAAGYAADAARYHSADPARPVAGNLTKDVMDWGSAPAGWSDAQFQRHNRAMIGALDIVSTDNYGWTDSYEWDQSTDRGSGHYGAWIYGHAIERLRFYAPRIPAYGFVECCDSGDRPPTNTMMPGMIETAVWNILVHGGRGVTYWTTDLYDSGHDPRDRPYPGAEYYGTWALYADHQWAAQYDRAKQVDRAVLAAAPELNSPTVAGIAGRSTSGVPVATLGKDRGGKLWLLAQADGDTSHPLSNTAPTTATITLPSTLPAGTMLNVVGENRAVTVDVRHEITDRFGTTTETPTASGTPITYGYEHHIYAQP